MKILFELSKEHKKIPTDEVLSVLNANDIKYEIDESNENILIIKSEVKKKIIKKISNQLSFTYYIDEFIFSSSNKLDEIKNSAKEFKIKEKGSIAIKYKKRSISVKSQHIIETIANIYTIQRKVDLINPDIEIRVLITDDKVYVGKKIYEINRSKFEMRKVQNRPFFSPISLHPKIARSLVNISQIKKDETLLDPFCGTGGILLEAGLIGAKIIGSDIEEKMIEGCKKTLDFYNVLEYKLFESDIGSISEIIKKPIDAIVTDLPYGKSTTTKGEDIKILYKRFFESIKNIIKKEGFVIIGLSNPNLISLGEKYLKLVKIYDFKVHRSMTRYFAVYKK